MRRNNSNGSEDATQGRQHHWHDAFIEQRNRFSKDAAVWLFGHALMEKLVKPYKAITAHMWVVIAPSDFFQMTHELQRVWLDAKVAEQLQLPDELTTNASHRCRCWAFRNGGIRKNVAFMMTLACFAPK